MRRAQLLLSLLAVVASLCAATETTPVLRVDIADTTVNVSAARISPSLFDVGEDSIPLSGAVTLRVVGDAVYVLGVLK